MSEILDRSVKQILSAGITGPHTMILLIRWANLSDDRNLMRIIGNTLAEQAMPENASLAYAYAEYYEAERADFCPLAASFVLERCGREDRMLLPSLAKCARVFREQKYLDEAVTLAEKAENNAFTAIGLVELYRATFNEQYLNRAAEIGRYIQENIEKIFSPQDSYDVEQVSSNSALCVLFDELARILQEERWEKARKVQNRMLSILADKYPHYVTFGLCALLSDEFESKTVVCAIPEGETPPEVEKLLEFYDPLTEILVVPADTDRTRYFILKHGKLEELKGI